MEKPITIFRLVVAICIAVLTITLLFGVVNAAAERAYSDGTESTLPCLNLDDPVKPVTAKPNSVCRQKLPESPVIEYSFNACGHRTNERCHLDEIASGRRVVLLGSSLVEGYGVPLSASFAQLLPAEIERISHQSVDIYNEAMQWGTPRSVALRMDEVLSEKPLMVIWPITPFDVQNAALRLPYIPGKHEADQAEDPSVSPMTPMDQPPLPTTFSERLVASYRKHGGAGIFAAGFDRAMDNLRQTKAVFGAQHLMYGNQREFIEHFLGNLTEANYLFTPPEPSAQAQLKTFERYYAKVSQSLKAAGIPLYVTMLPSHPQVSLLSGAAGLFPRADPRLLDRQLQEIVERHGDDYISIVDGFVNVPHPADYFYAVDEHANERGHALFANVIAERLADTPSFSKSLRPSAPVKREMPN